MTESEPLMEMDPAPSEQSTPSTMFSGGLSAPGQREGCLCLPSCEPALISSFNSVFFLSCRKPSRPCATALTCTGAGWCWSGQTRRRRWRPCAAKPPSTSTVTPPSLPASLPPGTHWGLAATCWSLSRHGEASRPGLCLTALPVRR